MKVLEFISYLMIPLMMVGILGYGCWKKEKVYDLFIEGAKDGFQVIFCIFPTLLAMMIAIQLLQKAGGMEIVSTVLMPISKWLQIPSEIIPLGIMRSVSGGASVGLLANALQTYGPDSFIGRVASTIMGSSETTLYVLAVYVAATKVKDTRNVLYISLFADFVAVLLATYTCRWL